MINNVCYKRVLEICLVLSIFVIGFLFNIFTAKAITISEYGSYQDSCWEQYMDPYYFYANKQLGVDYLEDTPFYFITENIVVSNSVATINYQLFALNTNDIYFDLTGGTFYYYNENGTDVFTLSSWSCSTNPSDVNTEYQQDIQYEYWVNNWVVNRDFNVSSWNRSAFRKFNNNNLIEYSINDLISGFGGQISNAIPRTGPYIVSSNFDLYDSNGNVIFKNSIPEPEPEPVPPTTDDLINNINDSINDSNVSGAIDNGTDFFNNFQLEDNGNLSTIFTAPFRLLNAIISGNCTSLIINIWGSDVSIPCGSIFWSNFPESIINLYNLFVGGFISYYSLVDLYHHIKNLKDPDVDRIDVIDL